MGPILGLDDTLKYKISNCATSIDICIDVPLSDMSEFQITNNGQPYANGITGCNFDTLNLYDYSLVCLGKELWGHIFCKAGLSMDLFLVHLSIQLMK